MTYLYTGTAPNLKTLASELLEVAEKYQLFHLLTKCENELGRNIKMLLLADLHGRSALKKVCFKFIRVNSAEVHQTSEWADFKEHKDQYASLFVEFLENTLTMWFACLIVWFACLNSFLLHIEPIFFSSKITIGVGGGGGGGGGARNHGLLALLDI